MQGLHCLVSSSCAVADPDGYHRYQLDNYREAFRTLMERSAVGKVTPD